MTPKDPKQSYEPKIVGDDLGSIYPLKIHRCTRIIIKPYITIV